MFTATTPVLVIIVVTLARFMVSAKDICEQLQVAFEKGTASSSVLPSTGRLLFVVRSNHHTHHNRTVYDLPLSSLLASTITTTTTNITTTTNHTLYIGDQSAVRVSRVRDRWPLLSSDHQATVTTVVDGQGRDRVWAVATDLDTMTAQTVDPTTGHKANWSLVFSATTTTTTVVGEPGGEDRILAKRSVSLVSAASSQPNRLYEWLYTITADEQHYYHVLVTWDLDEVAEVGSGDRKWRQVGHRLHLCIEYAGTRVVLSRDRCAPEWNYAPWPQTGVLHQRHLYILCVDQVLVVAADALSGDGVERPLVRFTYRQWIRCEPNGENGDQPDQADDHQVVREPKTKTGASEGSTSAAPPVNRSDHVHSHNQSSTTTTINDHQQPQPWLTEQTMRLWLVIAVGLVVATGATAALAVLLCRPRVYSGIRDTSASSGGAR